MKKSYHYYVFKRELRETIISGKKAAVCCKECGAYGISCSPSCAHLENFVEHAYMYSVPCRKCDSSDFVIVGS